MVLQEFDMGNLNDRLICSCGCNWFFEVHKYDTKAVAQYLDEDKNFVALRCMNCPKIYLYSHREKGFVTI